MFRTVLLAARPPFLLLTPLCVLLGVGSALLAGASPSPGLWALILLGALLAHAAVNLLNEFEDFQSGLDQQTQRTPFSGGSGALPAQPAAAPAVLVTALVALGLTALLGVFLVTRSGPGLLLVGLAGGGVILAYTRWLTRSPLLCLIAPGLGIALITVGTHYALTTRFDLEMLWVALTPFWLGNALLLLNQFPDAEADKTVQRRHLPIVLGRRRAAGVFALMLAAAYLSPALAVGFGVLPPPALAALLPAPVAGWLVLRVYHLAEARSALVPWLGVNVGVILATLLLLGGGLLVAGLN